MLDISSAIVASSARAWQIYVRMTVQASRSAAARLGTYRGASTFAATRLCLKCEQSHVAF